MVRSLSLIGLLLAVLPLHAEPLPLAILLDYLDGSAVVRVGQAEQDVLAAQRSAASAKPKLAGSGSPRPVPATIASWSPKRCATTTTVAIWRSACVIHSWAA